MGRYRRRSFQVPPRLVDEVAAELWACATLGLEIVEGDEWTRIDAYFVEATPGGLLEDEEWCRRGVVSLAEEWLEDQDWLATYRAHSRPFRLGARFLVDPREPDRKDGPDDVKLLRIPARRAFGVGSHATTQLVVEALEELTVLDRRVLDVGTGTAILCLVALRLGAGWALGYDREIEAVLVAHENRRLNGLWPRLFAGRLDSIAPEARFDLILVNVLPERISGDLPALVPLLEASGQMIVSGLLESQRPELELRYESLGLAVQRRWNKEEWACLLLERRAT